MEVNELVWDKFGLDHIQKHEVTQLEIIEASQRVKLVLAGKKGRLLVVGVTKIKRIITFVLDKKEKGKYYVVTARDASRKERRAINEEIN